PPTTPKTYGVCARSGATSAQSSITATGRSSRRKAPAERSALAARSPNPDNPRRLTPSCSRIDLVRDGSMRDIVETIQRDQLLLVSDERKGLLVIQGGPGTGKTAVGLHRVTC